MTITFRRQKVVDLAGRPETGDAPARREEPVTSQPGPGPRAENFATNDMVRHIARMKLGENSSAYRSDTSAVGSYACRLEPGQYGFASVVSRQSYTATVGATTVRFGVEDATSRLKDGMRPSETTPVDEPLGRAAAKSDRRRSGRINDVSPTLIPLLRSNAEPNRAFEDKFDDDLGPAFGVITSVKLSILIWAGIVLVVGFFMWLLR